MTFRANRRFDISTEKPERFTFIAFCDGLHCPICPTQIAASML
jgi:hypothetical protein